MKPTQADLEMMIHVLDQMRQLGLNPVQFVLGWIAMGELGGVN